MALNVTVQSYNGRLDYGLIACRRAVPDVNDLADALLSEHRTLMQLAQITPSIVQPIAAPATQVPKLVGKAPVRKRAKRLSVAA
jgi:hypothetical protein